MGSCTQIMPAVPPVTAPQVIRSQADEPDESCRYVRHTIMYLVPRTKHFTNPLLKLPGPLLKKRRPPLAMQSLYTMGPRYQVSRHGEEGPSGILVGGYEICGQIEDLYLSFRTSGRR